MSAWENEPKVIECVGPARMVEPYYCQLIKALVVVVVAFIIIMLEDQKLATDINEGFLAGMLVEEIMEATEASKNENCNIQRRKSLNFACNKVRVDESTDIK